MQHHTGFASLLQRKIGIEKGANNQSAQICQVEKKYQSIRKKAGDKKINTIFLYYMIWGMNCMYMDFLYSAGCLCVLGGELRECSLKLVGYVCIVFIQLYVYIARVAKQKR
jgi:hypothetical protein